MNLTSLYDKLGNHIGGNWILYLGDDKPNGVVDICEISAFLNGLTPEEVVAFWGQYPNLEDRGDISYVVVINTDDFTNAATVFPEGETYESFGEECLNRIHRLIFNKEYEGE